MVWVQSGGRDTVIYVAAYRGVSWISRRIQWWTWSKYSHVSLARRLPDGTWRNIEAWEGVGVRETDHPLSGHTPCTPVDLFAFRRPLTEVEQERLWSLALEELGKPYDYRGVLSFILRRRMQRDGAWFCSELVADKCAQVGHPLYICEPWRVTPGMVAESVALEYAFSM